MDVLYIKSASLYFFFSIVVVFAEFSSPFRFICIKGEKPSIAWKFAAFAKFSRFGWCLS